MPKFIQNDEVIPNIKASKEFTDREEPRRAFWKIFELVENTMKNQPVIQVISYYGFGGIGKTSLLHKLDQELKEKEPESKIEFLDFERLTEFNNNLLDILKVIRQDLKEKYNFTFPIFDLVTYVYETKMGKTATKPELNSIFDENKELGFLKDVISDIPLIGTFAKVIYYADSGKNLIQERLRNQKLRQRLLEIENTSIEDIKEHLAYYFSIDLKENLKNEKKPFVFFIDTYEKLVNELTQIGNPLKNDLWLRSDEGLICRVPNIVWVIAGREKLKWQEMDESWQGTLNQHLLGTLSFQDTSCFLKTAGIKDEELIKQIYSLTHGTPMYLDMCVDTYIKLKEQGKEIIISEFEGDTTELVNRFLIYMKDSERDFSIMLAYIPEWTDDNIEEIAMKMNGTFSYSLYEKVKNFSFIVNNDGKYSMHESVKDIIIANTPEILRNKYKKILQDNTNNKLKEIVENENKRVEEIYITKNNNQIAYIDQYDSKKAYKQLIENLKLKLETEKDEESFTGTAKFLLEKLKEYEERFNETIRLKFIENKSFKNNKYYNLLKTYENIYVDLHFYYRGYIEIYNTLIDVCGETEEEALFPIKHNLRWNECNIYDTEFMEDLFNFVDSKLGKDSLYYIALCGLCKNSANGRQQEFIKKIREYSHSDKIKNKFYIRLILQASEKYVVKCAFMEKYNNIYNSWNEKVSKEIDNEVFLNFKLAIKALEENSGLLDDKVLKQIQGIVESEINNYQLINVAFNYLYSVKYIALNTSNQQIIDCFIEILKGFLGGEKNEKKYTINDNELREKIIGFLIELKKHYIELYGKDSYNVNEIEDYIDKIE